MPHDRERLAAKVELVHADITAAVIHTFYKVYDGLGFGFLESVYRTAMALELEDRKLEAQREFPIDVFLNGRRVGHFRGDFLVERRVIVEVKASRNINDADRKQLLNYLTATNIEVGLLLHFGPKPAFHRVFFENAMKRNLPALYRG